MFECSYHLDLNVLLSWNRVDSSCMKFADLSCYWPSLFVFPKCFFFPESQTNWSHTLIFIVCRCNFPKMAIPIPIPHALLTMLLFSMERWGFCSPPLPWTLMRACACSDWCDVAGTMLWDLQGWVFKESASLVFVSFGIYLGSQAPCWEKPELSLAQSTGRDPHGEEPSPSVSSQHQLLVNSLLEDSTSQTLWSETCWLCCALSKFLTH